MYGDVKYVSVTLISSGVELEVILIHFIVLVFLNAKVLLVYVIVKPSKVNYSFYDSL